MLSAITCARGLCLWRGEVVWNGNNSVNLWGRVEQG